MANIPADIIEKVKNIPECQGIIFTGSRQNGTITKGSDWDFYVLLEDGAKSFRKTWNFNGELIETFCNTIESINKHELIRDKISNPALFMLATGEILQDDSGRLEKIQKKAKQILKQGPEQLNKEQIQLMGYHLKAIVDDLSSLQELKVDGLFLQDNAIVFAVECFYKLERKWMAKPREVESDLDKIDLKFAELYLKAHKKIGKERVEAIINLIEYLAKRHNVPMSGEVIQYRK